MSIPFTWVYLLHDPFTDFYKIGKSDRPDERHKQLCNPKAYGTIPAAPTDYTLLEAWLCPENEEATLHGELAYWRSHGEWFALGYAFDALKDPEKVLDCLMYYGTLASARRWILPGSFNEDRLGQIEHSYELTLNTMQVMHRRLEQAKLLGYAPLGLLAPKPKAELIERAIDVN